MDEKKLIELKQERANLVTNIRSIMTEYEGKEIGQEKRDELTKMENRFDELNGKITKEEKQLTRERIIGEKQEEDPKNRGIETDKEKEVRAAFTNFLRMGDASAAHEYRAIQQDNPSQAGYLVAPQKFVGEVIQAKNDLMFMRRISRVLPPLDKAQSLGYPKRTTRMSTFAWGTEIAAPTADTALAFGKREFIARPATGGILVSKTFIRNSAVDADTYIRGEMAYDFAVGEEGGFMNGTGGGGQPLGVFTASDDGISTSRDVSTGNAATEIKFDGLLEAKYSIKQQYQNNLQWIFGRTGVKQIAKLKDSDGQYVWQQSVVLGQPDRLLGFPVNMSENAPSTFTTGLYVGLLGDFSYYWICDSLNMEIQALLELYAPYNQIYYIGREETDGMPVLEEAFARVTLG
jgi:HK97 family phage major capsid protein